jgi:hypothetical protein
MPNDLTFSEVSESAQEQAEQYLTQVLKEAYPSSDLSEGRVIRQMVLNTMAILTAANQTEIGVLLQSFSPLSIAEDPTLADDDMVDKVYSNYRLERFEGNKASGLLSVIISDLTTTSVPADTVFTSNQLNYTVSQAYVGVTSQAAVVSSSERLIQSRPDGTYFFTVPVTAEEVGEAYRVKRGTRFTSAPTPPATIDIVAAADFSGGLAEETNTELAARAQEAIAPQAISGRAQNAALFMAAVDDLMALSQVGFGDPEMLRDRDNIFEWSHGGKSDIYVRTVDRPQEVKLTKECTYIGESTWQVTILRDDAPGFYLVTAVVAEGTTDFSGSLEMVSELRGYDLTPETDWTHDIQNTQEGVYTRYQTAIVQFLDASTPLDTPLGTKVNYDVYVSRIPDVQTLHDITVDRAARPPAGDYLIKAAVPAYVSVSLLVSQRSGSPDPDPVAIQEAVASQINSLGFNTGRVNLSVILAAAHRELELGGTAVLTPISLSATLYPPNTVPYNPIFLNDPNELVVPDLPERGVTQRTTIFYLDPQDVAVSVQPMPGISI